jgi:ATP-dependent Clp protease ATP-binding subunit ClpC
MGGAGSVVDVGDIEAVAAQWTGIPVQRMTDDEAATLATMDDSLRACVIGQEEAVSAVARSLRRTRCGLKDPNRPIASMLFAGPTGVGKTELTKSLAEKYFGSADNMVRLDMSEYMERHSVSKLVGAPPGYVGFGQGGTLTEAVRRTPFTILLFDEIEKAHPDVFNILLQMMEDGRLTDSTGRVVSFKNTLIVLTSNVGSKVIAKGGQTLGFDLQEEFDDNGDSAAYKRMRDKVLEELKNFFRPEMLNRLDEIVCFKQLERESVSEIGSIMLRETASRVRVKGMEMALTSAAMTKVLSEGFDQEYGARPLRRAITSIVDDSLSEALLRGKILEGDVAVIDYDEKFDGTLAAAETNGGEARAVSENTFGGVSVTAVAGDPSQRGYDIAWTSVGMDLEGRPGEDLAGPANNVVKSTSAPVGVNDTVNN